MLNYFKKQFDEGTELHGALSELLKNELKKLAFEYLLKPSSVVDEDISKLRGAVKAMFQDAINKAVEERFSKLESRVVVVEKRIEQLES